MVPVVDGGGNPAGEERPMSEGYQPRRRELSGDEFVPGEPPRGGSGAFRPGGPKSPEVEAAEKAAWIALAATALLVGREISGRSPSHTDAANAVDIARRVYDEASITCGTPPTRAL